jgi:hypothetical protein
MSVEGFQSAGAPRIPTSWSLPGIRRYVQSHTRGEGYRKGEPVYDGIAEIWFDDPGAMRALSPARRSMPLSRPTRSASSIERRWV